MSVVSPELHDAVMRFDEYVRQYWRDHEKDGAYGCLVQTVYSDQAGEVLGVSEIGNAPTDDLAKVLRQVVLDRDFSALDSAAKEVA